MILDKCSEGCGYAAAIGAALCMGSFGVPVKSEVIARLDVDPLVVQSYKTLVCFLTSWLIIPMGEPVRFTYWGILSGIFWVPGGWAGIYAIRTAGIATAAGTWSAMIVLTSFGWGIFIFEERVKSKLGACCACGTLILGLIGMSTFSRPRAPPSAKKSAMTRVHSSSGDLAARAHKGEAKTPISKRISAKKGTKKKPHATATAGVITIIGKVASPSSQPLTSLEMASLVERTDAGDHSAAADRSRKRIPLCGGHVTQRQLGILAALFNGIWGGTNMIPLHYAAHAGYGGPSYVISFACGSMIVVAGCWALRYLWELYRLEGAVVKAYHALPSFYVRQIGLPCGLSGTLYSGGNFLCIIAVTYLGQGVGYSFVQASMLVSGLWGIFRFKEIEGRGRIINWLLSACVAIVGILWLSYEHA